MSAGQAAVYEGEGVASRTSGRLGWVEAEPCEQESGQARKDSGLLNESTNFDPPSHGLLLSNRREWTPDISSNRRRSEKKSYICTCFAICLRNFLPLCI